MSRIQLTTLVALVAVVTLMSMPRSASAQLIGGGGNLGGGLGGGTAGGNTNFNRNAGLTQSGQVEASGAVARNQETFVGSSTGGVSHPLSVAAANGQDGLSNFGSIPGFNPNGSSNALGTGGLGGFGGLTSGLGGLGGLNSLGGGFGNRSLGNQLGSLFGNQLGNQNATQTQGSVPVRIVIGFETTPTGSSIVASRLQARYGDLPGLRDGLKATVVMEGRVAVLQGTAVSERERDLAERLAMLEPGIDAVRNEVRVELASDGGAAAEN